MKEKREERRKVLASVIGYYALNKTIKVRRPRA